MGTPADVCIFLGSHVTRKDAFSIREHITQCDVFSPELAGWCEATQQAYEMVAKSLLAPENLLLVGENFGEFAAAQLFAIADTGVDIRFIDVPDGNALVEELHDLSELIALLPRSPQPYESAISSLRQVYEEFAAVNRRRESYMVRRLYEMACERPGERILVRLGSAHSAVARMAAAHGLQVTTRIQTPFRCFDIDVQPYRYAQYRRPIPTVALARHLLAGLLQEYWFPEGLSPQPGIFETLVRRVAMRFSEPEVGALWNRFADGTLTREVMARAVAAHGFVLVAR